MLVLSGVADVQYASRMRLVPKRWHNETWVCSMRGHVAPAARAARLRPDDVTIGVDAADGTRLSRCFRCDMWIRLAVPAGDDIAYDVVPPLDELDLPRRGKPLQDAILLRLVALDRAVHAVIFAHEAAVERGIELRLAVSPDGSVRRVLQLIGVGSVVPVYSSLAEAMDTGTGTGTD